MIGSTLDGKYHITKLLGAGAMGQVFEAEHTATGRRVAVKVINSPELVKDQTVVGRFQREARAAGSIDTQHITQVLDAGVDRETELPFLVMEYLNGEDVSALIKRLGPLAPELALRIVAQACLGLQKAHEAQVVHRDMKPANLFLAKRDAGEIIVKVLDFGIAKVKMDAASDENHELTKTGSMIGSPLYMSPEQARGDVKHIDARTDIWSMGVVLYQALCGRTPYGHLTALGQLIIAICSEWPPHIQEMAPWVPPNVATIVHRCLRHNPDERFQSSSEMFLAIKAQLPNGWTINEEMITPLDETARHQVASKLALTSALCGGADGHQPAAGLGGDQRRHRPAQPASAAARARERRPRRRQQGRPHRGRGRAARPGRRRRLLRHPPPPAPAAAQHPGRRSCERRASAELRASADHRVRGHQRGRRGRPDGHHPPPGQGGDHALRRLHRDRGREGLRQVRAARVQRQARQRQAHPHLEGQVRDHHRRGHHRVGPLAPQDRAHLRPAQVVRHPDRRARPDAPRYHPDVRVVEDSCSIPAPRSWVAAPRRCCSRSTPPPSSPSRRLLHPRRPRRPPTGPAGDAPRPAVPDESKKAEARAHFDKGLKLLQEEAWAAALAEFLTSRELYPTRAATNNAAIALRKLQRFDESLDMFETLLREFPNMPPGERTLAQRAVAELRELTGTIDVTGAEPGAAIVIGGQAKGDYPPISPLRVSAGTHLVRLVKEGFQPFEARADVAGGQTLRIVAKMTALTASGRLKVAERSGYALEVLVDNVVVGVTPWEGTQSVGSHTVNLRGKGRQGTPPAAAVVKSRELTALTLVAEELDAALRVDPTPPNATVVIDSVPVGHGTWIGWLKSGKHKVEVGSEGFLPVARDVTLQRGGREIVAVQLDRDPNSALWKKPSRWVFEVNAGVPLTPTLAGGVDWTCTGSCGTSIGVGAVGLFHAGYQLGSGVGFGIAAGYVFATQSVTGRATELVPNNRNGQPPPQQGTADDQLRLSSFLGGASVFYHLGDKVPVLFRLGVGALVGQVRDQRTGSFTASTSTTPYNTFAVVDFEKATYLYFDPEIRFGIRLGEHVDLSLGAQVLLFLGLSQPKWNQSIQVGAGGDGIGNYRPDPTMGSFLYAIAPSASLRYDF